MCQRNKSSLLCTTTLHTTQTIPILDKSSTDRVSAHSQNPLQVFNAGGPNVYPGCPQDYTGRNVDKYTVLAVLNGDARAVAGRGSGKVLRNDPTQKVFFFYSGHGSPGSITMPTGYPIYADEFNAVLNSMMAWNTFGEMLIYLEACEAGSIFRGFGLEWQSRQTRCSLFDSRSEGCLHHS